MDSPEELQEKLQIVIFRGPITLMETRMSESDPIQTTRQDGVTVVTLGPHFDSLYESVLPELASLLDLADSVEPPRLLIDLDNTKYFGSAFIGFVISLSQRIIKRPNGRLGIANVAPFCRMALETTKSDQLLELFDDVEHAVAAMGWK